MVVIFINNLYFTAILALDFSILYSTVLHLPHPSDSTLYRRMLRAHGTVECCDQREGMGLLEYQAMPYLRDLAHDG
jgi:hypothetical protein